MLDYTSVCVRRLARFYCAPDWSWDVQGQSNWTSEQCASVLFNFNLWTVLQGKGTLKAPCGTFDLQAGDCFILRGDEHYSARHNTTDPLVIFAVHFDFLDKNSHITQPKTELHRRIKNMEFFLHLLERMEVSWQEQSQDADFWLSACIKELLDQDKGLPIHGFRREQIEKIKKICTRIRSEPNTNYKVDDLAKELHCSRHHFSRIFKQITDSSPQDFLVKTKIETAKGLLHSSSYTVGRISELLGYKDIYFFSRQFKAKTGVSPVTYRNCGSKN